MPSPEQEAADAFRTCLLNLAQHTRLPEPSVARELSKRFREALLLFSSQSDDNIGCAEHLEIGTIRTNYGPASLGLMLRGTDFAVSNVLWHAEGCPIPEQVLEVYPELTQPQWDACMRLATLVLIALESKVEGSSE